MCDFIDKYAAPEDIEIDYKGLQNWHRLREEEQAERLAQAAEAVRNKQFITFLPESLRKDSRELHQITGQNMTYHQFVENIEEGLYNPAQLRAILSDGTVMHEGKPYFSLPAKYAVRALLDREPGTNL